MVTYTVRRILSTIPTLVLVSIIVFGLIRLTPGDPVVYMLGDEASPERVAELRRLMGFDQPLPVQYVRWAGRALTGDLGRSLRTNKPVGESVLQRLPVSVELTLLAMCVALSIAIPAGVASATRRGSWVDSTSAAGALLGVSMPNFLVGFLLIYLLAVLLRLLPPSGYVPLGESPAANLKLMIMPAITLGTAAAGVTTRLTRSSLLEVLAEDYVRTARAKGVAERLVIYRHALKNALIPVITVVGLQVGNLLAGAIITETIFGLPGMGRLVVDAIFARDYPIVQGVILFAALMFMAVNLVVDLTYALLDPRIKYA